MSTTVVMPSATMERRRSSSNALEKFPDLDTSFRTGSQNLRVATEISPGHLRSPSPQKHETQQIEGHKQAKPDGHLTWKDSFRATTGQRQHDRQKSLSEAFRNIRTRRASVSENASEIAEALKAPLSVRLVVSESGFKSQPSTEKLRETGALSCMVHELGPYEHLLQIDPQFLPETYHAHDYPICVRLGMVYIFCVPRKVIPIAQDVNTSSQEWHSVS